MVDLATRLEAVLFSEGGPISHKRLMSLLECTAADLKSALTELAKRREGSGIAVVATDTEASLAVASGAAETVKKAFEKELGKEIGEAGLEVLSIVLYRGPSTRASIDYIRGVNTSSTLRNLLARGLLERVPNPDDAREYLYRPTVELLAHLGITELSQLPDHAAVAAELAAFEAKKDTAHDGE